MEAECEEIAAGRAAVNEGLNAFCRLSKGRNGRGTTSTPFLFLDFIITQGFVSEIK